MTLAPPGKDARAMLPINFRRPVNHEHAALFDRTLPGLARRGRLPDETIMSRFRSGFGHSKKRCAEFSASPGWARLSRGRISNILALTRIKSRYPLLPNRHT